MIDAAPADQIGSYGDFRQGFAEAVDNRLYSIADIDAMVLSGRAKFLASRNAAILAEVRAYPSRQVFALHGLYATGDLGEILGELIPQAEAWGKQIGCSYAFIDSREAWRRLLEPQGYDPYKFALMKEL